MIVKKVNKINNNVLTPEYVLLNYRKVSIFGEWYPIRKYAGVLDKLIKENFKFM